MNVHFVVHEAFEAPGAYETWVRDRGYAASYSRLYANDPLPNSMDEIDLLIVMGGPQCPSTSKEECPHFDAAAEKRLIAECIAGGKAVIGVCLGAQLIGEALGAPFMRSPHTEIGKFSVTLTTEGQLNPLFSHFGRELTVGHWHNDMPGLTADAKIVAFSKGCPRQIVEYGPFIYGFQCHMEFTAEVIELLIAASEGELAAKADCRFVQQAPELRANDWDEMNELLIGFLDKLMVAYALGGAQVTAAH